MLRLSLARGYATASGTVPCACRWRLPPPRLTGSLPRLFRFDGPGVRVGFIGLGNMGGHMARNLLKANLPVTVLDVNKDAVAALTKDGATAAGASRKKEICTPCGPEPV